MGLLRLAEVPASTCTADATVMDAIRLMVDRGIGALAIVEGKKVVGIFSERDLMRRVVFKGLDPSKTKITDVMTRDVEKVLDSTSVKAAVAMMRAKKFRHLPILDGNGDLIGMVALRFLLYDIMDDLEKEATGLQNYSAADGPGG
jgi:CBS domain-containing protein